MERCIGQWWTKTVISICIYLLILINLSVCLLNRLSTCLFIRWLWSQRQSGLNSNANPRLPLIKFGPGP